MFEKRDVIWQTLEAEFDAIRAYKGWPKELRRVPDLLIRSGTSCLCATKLWDMLSVCHKAANTGKLMSAVELAHLREQIELLKEPLSVFRDTKYPPLQSSIKTYDHIVLSHLLAMIE